MVTEFVVGKLIGHFLSEFAMTVKSGTWKMMTWTKEKLLKEIHDILLIFVCFMVSLIVELFKL